MPLTEAAKMRASPPAPPLDTSMETCAAGDDATGYLVSTFIDSNLLDFVSTIAFGKDGKDAAITDTLSFTGGLKVTKCGAQGGSPSSDKPSETDAINCRGGETKGCLGDCTTKSESSASWEMCESGPLGSKSGYFSAELEMPAIKKDLFGRAPHAPLPPSLPRSLSPSPLPSPPPSSPPSLS